MGSRKFLAFEKIFTNKNVSGDISETVEDIKLRFVPIDVSRINVNFPLSGLEMRKTVKINRFWTPFTYHIIKLPSK